jgi:F-type H+-transporting ATPase subunit c
MRKTLAIGFSLLVSLVFASMAMAADPAGGASAGLGGFFSYAVIAAGFGMGIAAFGTGIGQGLAVKSSVEGIARNPEASGKITVTMLIGLAMIESLAIYALVVALIILYAYPMTKPIATALGFKV